MIGESTRLEILLDHENLILVSRTSKHVPKFKTSNEATV